MCDSNGFFAGISPTSSGFAIGKKIRYDRGNKRMMRKGIIKHSLSLVPFQLFSCVIIELNDSERSEIGRRHHTASQADTDIA